MSASPGSAVSVLDRPAAALGGCGTSAAVAGSRGVEGVGAPILPKAANGTGLSGWERNISFANRVGQAMSGKPDAPVLRIGVAVGVIYPALARTRSRQQEMPSTRRPTRYGESAARTDAARWRNQGADFGRATSSTAHSGGAP